jgi:hypothetical protein
LLVDELRRGVRIAAYYLLPWAMACDRVTLRLISLRPSWRAYFWYISATLMAVIVLAHLLTLMVWYAYYTDTWGHTVPPCVCEATVQHVMHVRASSGNLLFDFASIVLNVVVILWQITSFLSDVFEVLFSRPYLCLIVLLLVVGTRLI